MAQQTLVLGSSLDIVDFYHIKPVKTLTLHYKLYHHLPLELKRVSFISVFNESRDSDCHVSSLGLLEEKRVTKLCSVSLIQPLGNDMPSWHRFLGGFQVAI